MTGHSSEQCSWMRSHCWPGDCSTTLPSSCVCRPGFKRGYGSAAVCERKSGLLSRALFSLASWNWLLLLLLLDSDHHGLLVVIESWMVIWVIDQDEVVCLVCQYTLFNLFSSSVQTCLSTVLGLAIEVPSYEVTVWYMCSVQ